MPAEHRTVDYTCQSKHIHALRESGTGRREAKAAESQICFPVSRYMQKKEAGRLMKSRAGGGGGGGRRRTEVDKCAAALNRKVKSF